VWADAQVLYPKRMALLIGNWDYDSNGDYNLSTAPNFLKDLKNPCKDTKLIKQSLVQAKFEISDFCNLDRNKFTEKSKEFISKTKNLPPGSTIIFYYAGHGVQVNGYLFALPISFSWNYDLLNDSSARHQSEFFLENAIEFKYILANTPDNNDITIAIILDNCRDNPFNDSVEYDQSTLVSFPVNSIVQYSTSVGNTASDNGQYAKYLSENLSHGGDLVNALIKVHRHFFKLYDQKKISYYVGTSPGAAIFGQEPRNNLGDESSGEKAIVQSPSGYSTSNEMLKTLKVDGSPIFGLKAIKADDAYQKLLSKTMILPSIESSEIFRHTQPIRKKDDGMRLDILWCEGEDEKEHYQYALHLARELSLYPKEFGLGRIQVKPLPVNTCLLYTSPSPRDRTRSRMPSSA